MSSERKSGRRKRTSSTEKGNPGGKIKNTGKNSSLDHVDSILLFSRPFNLSTERQDSETSSNIVSPSTSGICFKEHSGKHKPLSESIMMDDPVSLNPRDRNKLSRLSRNSETKTPVDDSVENLVLKSTQETINFGAEMSENTQCVAERLRLGDYRKSSGEVTTRSDTFFSDNLLDELYADAQGEEWLSSENISQSYVPFQTKESIVREPDTLATEIKEGKKLQDFLSFRKNLSFHIPKSQIVAFFGRKKREKRRKEPKTDFVEVHVDPLVSEEEDLATKFYLQKFYFNTLELIFVTGISLIMLSSSMFYLSDVTKGIFMDKTYGPVYVKNSSEGENYTSDYYPALRNSRTIEDFWAYAENTLIKLLYWDFYYHKLGKFDAEEDDRKLFNDNQILGVARIRQVRVLKNFCHIYPYVKRYFNSCYPPYSVLWEDTNPIRLDMDGRITATAWKFKEAESLLSHFHWGKLAVYGGGGYYADFPKTRDGAREMVKELKENNWVTKATRAIFIDFNLYNANINIFCLCKILVEMPASGGLIPASSFDSVKLIRYLTKTDFFVLGCEIVYFMFIVYDSVNLVRLMRSDGLSFLFATRNYFDILIILLSVLALIISIVRYCYSNTFLVGIETRDGYSDLTILKNIQLTFNHTIAIIVFCNWMRLFTYLTFTKRMVQFNKTLRKSLKDMFVFMPMFLTVLLAFSTLGCTLFGSKVAYYSTITQSFLALLQTFLGEFNFYEIFDVHPVLGPLFYILFIFFIFFVLLNVFIAIVNESYMTVMSQVMPEIPRSGEYIKRAFINFFTCYQPKRIKKKSYTRAGRKKLLFKEIQNSLKNAGFTQQEIQIFFYKYNINCGNFLDDRTKTRIMKDVELKRINLDETTEHFQINLLRRRLDEFRERMEDWEIKLQPIIDKVDVLLHRL